MDVVKTFSPPRSPRNESSFRNHYTAAATTGSTNADRHHATATTPPAALGVSPAYGSAAVVPRGSSASVSPSFVTHDVTSFHHQPQRSNPNDSSSFHHPHHAALAHEADSQASGSRGGDDLIIVGANDDCFRSPDPINVTAVGSTANTPLNALNGDNTTHRFAFSTNAASSPDGSFVGGGKGGGSSRLRSGGGGGGSGADLSGANAAASHMSSSNSVHQSNLLVSPRGGIARTFTLKSNASSSNGAAEKGRRAQNYRHDDEDSEGDIDLDDLGSRMYTNTIHEAGGGGGGASESSFTTSRASVRGGKRAAAAVKGKVKSSDEEDEKVDEEDDDNKNIFRRSKRPKFRCPLFFLLVLQIALIIGAFVVIIAFTAVKMNTMVEKMVTEKVESDLTFANTSIISPILEQEMTLHLVRDRYLTQSALFGREMCSDDSANFASSKEFLTDATLVRLQQPQVVYVFHIRRSKQHFNAVSGEAELVACAAIPTGLLTLTNGENRFSLPVTQQLLEADMLGVWPFGSRPDRIDFLYGLVRLGTPHLSWNTILSYDPDIKAAFLYLIAFAPNEVNRTDPITGEVTTFRPKIKGKQTLDPTLVSTAMTGLALNLTQFKSIMDAVTPAGADDSHTSLYNLDKLQLIATNAKDCPLYHNAGPASYLFAAGKTPSASVNEAFNVMKEYFTVTQTVPSISNGGSLYKMTATSFRVKLNENDRVISATPIVSDSGINFVVIQSTPRSHYFTTALELRDFLIIVGVIVGIAIIIVCTVVGASIRVPLSKLRQGMELAARMKNGRVVSTNSLLTELDVLCAAFDQMNFKLLQARDFMPQALLIDTSSNEEDDDAEDGEGEHVGALSPGGNHYITRDGHIIDAFGFRKQSVHLFGGADVRSDFDESNSEIGTVKAQPYSSLSPSEIGGLTAFTSSMYQQKRAAAAARAVPLHSFASSSTDQTDTTAGNNKLSSAAANQSRFSQNALQQKRVTILVVNVRGFYTKVSMAAPASIVDPTTVLTNAINTICLREKGVIDSFHGDHFVLSFNAVKANAQGPAKAARCALDIIAEMGGGTNAMNAKESSGRGGGQGAKGKGGVPMKQQQQQSHLSPFAGNSGNNSNSNDLTFSMGISTGKALVGHLGCTGMKRLSIIGKVYSRAVALERMCKRINEHGGLFDAKEAQQQQSGGGNKKNAGSSFNVSYQHHPFAAPIEVVTDTFVATEIQHSFMLQIVCTVAGGGETMAMRRGRWSRTREAATIAANENPLSCAPDNSGGSSNSEHSMSQHRRPMMGSNANNNTNNTSNTNIGGGTVTRVTRVPSKMMQQQQQQQQHHVAGIISSSPNTPLTASAEPNRFGSRSPRQNNININNNSNTVANQKSNSSNSMWLSANALMPPASLFLPMPHPTKEIDLYYTIKGAKHRSAGVGDEWLYELNETVAKVGGGATAGGEGGKNGASKATDKGANNAQGGRRGTMTNGVTSAELEGVDTAIVGEMCLAAVNQALAAYFESLQQNAHIVNIVNSFPQGNDAFANTMTAGRSCSGPDSPLIITNTNQQTTANFGNAPPAPSNNPPTATTPMHGSVGLGGIALLATSQGVEVPTPQARSDRLSLIEAAMARGPPPNVSTSTGFFSNSTSLALAAQQAAVNNTNTTSNNNPTSFNHPNTIVGNDQHVTMQSGAALIGAPVGGGGGGGGAQPPRLPSLHDITAATPSSQQHPLTSAMPSAAAVQSVFVGAIGPQQQQNQQDQQQQQQLTAAHLAATLYSTQLSAVYSAKRELLEALEEIATVYGDRLNRNGNSMTPPTAVAAATATPSSDLSSALMMAAAGMGPIAGGGATNKGSGGFSLKQQSSSLLHASIFGSMSNNNNMNTRLNSDGHQLSSSHMAGGGSMRVLSIGRQALEYAFIIASHDDGFYGVIAQE